MVSVFIIRTDPCLAAGYVSARLDCVTACWPGMRVRSPHPIDHAIYQVADQ